LGDADTLLVSATPVVNNPKDLLRLLRLFLPDHALAVLGVPSLEGAADIGDHMAITYAATQFTVARSERSITLPHDMRMPAARDGRVERLAPLPVDTLDSVLEQIDQLTFPGFDGTPGAHLLRAHLYHRLASSPEALRDTLRRHTTYLDRAETAASLGEHLSRRESRTVFGPGDDLQFELGVYSCQASEPTSGQSFAVERDRVLRLLRRLPFEDKDNPKAARLRELLCHRHDRKTIVFVTAVSTALDLARRLQWRETAVVAGGQAWIASGPTAPDTALNLFAPRARRAAEPSRSMRVTVLIATDLVSEGLDLQDADTVVHFDLPWSPVRLAQRVGRIARLGSSHTTAHICWFAPPPVLARRLRMELRLARKVRDQLELGVAATSVVGQGHVANSMLEAHERLATGRDVDPGRKSTVFAAVEAFPATMAAVTWGYGSDELRDLLALEGLSRKPIRDFRTLGTLLSDLAHAPSAERELRPGLAVPLMEALRCRLQLVSAPPSDRATVWLRRRLLRLARSAYTRRDERLLALLDATLEQLNAGLREGSARELRDQLTVRPRYRPLETWLARRRPISDRTPAFTIDAAVFSTDHATQS
jgi:hypothetical protein